LSMHLASHGARVFAGYFQNDDGADRLASNLSERGLSCETVKANLLTSSGIQTLFERVLGQAGRLDALVHNAATGVHRPLVELTQRHLSTVWQVNVGAFFDLALKFRPHMPVGARVVAISSEGAARAVQRYGAVGSSKAALEALCRQMAMEWCQAGINVNVVAPGLLDTDTLNALERPEERVTTEIAGSPLGRLVALEEVAAVVHFLCSSASSAVVGQTLIVDGGKRIASAGE